MRNDVKYVISYIPKAAVEKICAEHPEQIEEGASVWDICGGPEALEKTVDCGTEKEALAMAEKILPEDEFGELQIYEMTLLEDPVFKECWEYARKAVFYGGEIKLEWVGC